ncbi:cytosolic 5'-nucleotidase 1B [Echeneis naucrates]|uniref:Cytosolic 5'-nucleotidase 1B-like n=1 Tax=Echeneis naucrates TaxID=173247 RepID=A0A665UA53_ECHNA|nr:cytosolic 5'-nucleotidase 1B-like [Echeneis naucrates]
MLSTVRNDDVTQKDADRAVVVAVTSRAVFECGADDDEVYKVGRAFPLLQALRRVNERLLEQDSAETLLFDVVLVTTDRQQQQQRSRIISSTRRHGLEVGRFCFSSEEDFIEGLLKNSVGLFLTTEGDEASQASQKGVVSALLEQQTTSCSSEKLRVFFCGDSVIQPETGPTPASRAAAQSFSTQVGEMRRKFSMTDSPLSVVMVMSRGGRDSCCAALHTLRFRGVSVDEVYCLAGAPRGPILSELRPHFWLSDGFSSLEE